MRGRDLRIDPAAGAGPAETEGASAAVRRLNTLRISVTGRCDLECAYCSAAGDSSEKPELSPQEIALLAEAAALAGARTVRLTGGEPLLRGDIEEIVGRVRRVAAVRDIALTTNAQALSARARPLRDAGLDRVNVGLPSLRPETYREVTGGDLAPALAGLEAALSAGLAPVKLNVVVVKGANETEIHEFVEFARRRPVEVRFIERMPFAGTDSLVPASEIRSSMAASLGTEALPHPELSPTAEVYRPRGFAGRIGIISPVTEPFCRRCDRLRVTSDGKLRPCLSEPAETDLRAMLKSGAAAEELARAMRAAFGRKPAAHFSSFCGPMRTIGG